MCIAKSFKCIRGETTPRWSPKFDSHEKLNQEIKLKDAGNFRRDSVSVEYYPKNIQGWFNPEPDTHWVFKVDEEGSIPSWFEDERDLWKDRCWKIIEKEILPTIQKGHFPGDLSINSEAKLDALESVGGYLSINSEAKLDALKSVGGDLSINSEAKLDALESVGGYLYIHSKATLDAPKLESVGGDLSINSEAKLDALESVGGDLYINSEAKLDALESVGGYLYINSEAKLDAPKLESVNGKSYKK